MGMYENNPCYKCEDRVSGCHGQCEKYAVWILELREKQDVIYKKRNQEIKLAKFREENIRKQKRRKRKEV